MKFIEKFASFFSNLPSDFLLRLDRNFSSLARETEPFATSVAEFTLRSTDSIDSLQVDATAANATVYIPSSPTGNRRRRIIKTDSSANTVTVNGNGSLINGASTYVLASQYDKCDLEPTGTGWLIVN